jgi:tetratricopeptide (TPR) repeat protein
MKVEPKSNSASGQHDAACTAMLESTNALAALSTSSLLDLLAPFFPDGLHDAPAVKTDDVALQLLTGMGNLLVRGGFPGRALTVFAQQESLARRLGLLGAPALVAGLPGQLAALTKVGRLHDADLLAREGLDLAQRIAAPQAIGLCLVAFAETLLVRGSPDAAAAHQEASALLGDDNPIQWMSEALHLLHANNALDAARACRRTLAALDVPDEPDIPDVPDPLDNPRLPGNHNQQHDLWQFALHTPPVLAATARSLLGMSLARLGDNDAATDSFTSALRSADELGLTDAALPALLGLARLHTTLGVMDSARTMLQAAFGVIQQGPHRLADVDAHLILADLETKASSPSTAERARDRSATLAWCDGPPFSYANPLHRYT